MRSRPSTARSTAGYSLAAAALGLVGMVALLLDQPLSIIAAVTAFVFGALALHAGALQSRRTAVLAVGGLGLAAVCVAVWITWLLGVD